jgi:hypothetical protein
MNFCQILLLLPVFVRAANLDRNQNNVPEAPGNNIETIDCYTRLPLGRRKEEAETISHPPIGFSAGDVRFGQVKYVPGKPLHVKINYHDGGVRGILVMAKRLFGSQPEGSWLPPSTVQASTRMCGGPEDNSLSVGSLDKSGVIDAFWTPPEDLTGYVEFQLTVLGNDERFWLWNSFLCENSK